MRRAQLVLLATIACGGAPGSRGAAPALGAEQQGVATYYTFANGDGACMFGPSPDDLDVAAMNAPQWAGSAVCGACAGVAGPKGAVVVRIVDLCPECQEGHLDLSPQAFAKIADLAQGRVPISWRLQACDVTGPVRYRVKEGSSQWWTAIQVRNHRQPVAALAWRRDGAWVDLARADYDYFVAPAGVGPGPFSVRVTAWDGQTLEDALPGPDAGAVYQGGAQFR